MSQTLSPQQIQEIEDDWNASLEEEHRSWLTHWEANQLGVVVIDRPTHDGGGSGLPETN